MPILTLERGLRASSIFNDGDEKKEGYENDDHRPPEHDWLPSRTVRSADPRTESHPRPSLSITVAHVPHGWAECTHSARPSWLGSGACLTAWPTRTRCGDGAPGTTARPKCVSPNRPVAARLPSSVGAEVVDVVSPGPAAGGRLDPLRMTRNDDPTHAPVVPVPERPQRPGEGDREGSSRARRAVTTH